MAIWDLTILSSTQPNVRHFKQSRILKLIQQHGRFTKQVIKNTLLQMHSIQIHHFTFNLQLMMLLWEQKKQLMVLELTLISLFTKVSRHLQLQLFKQKTPITLAPLRETSLFTTSWDKSGTLDRPSLTTPEGQLTKKCTLLWNCTSLSSVCYQSSGSGRPPSSSWVSIGCSNSMVSLLANHKSTKTVS